MLLRSTDESQNTFVYQPKHDTLELKKGTDYALGWNERKYIIK